MSNDADPRQADTRVRMADAWQMLLGSLPLVAAAFLVPSPPIQWTPDFIAAVVFNAVLCNALAWMLWMYALQKLEAGLASMTSMLVPVIGVLSAWWQLGEEPGTLEIIGMLLIGVSLLIISIRSMRRHEEVDPAMGQD